ncbi:hypothetical protein bcCo53_001131 (plasmid) [Borrelia coriaceae]|uniref:Putative membrane spanning protein n=1 Tax=Borrelia coriaceae ATCC 43381 TaxID=1408429 RepID=W5SW48_9SPIR|nr:virulence associated lipoprotein [Borrelia coriaceae]AHH11165.1 Putative membrane spanning protein [Borrelia coriaceae ATCC 43381]UPA16963.1 hypothetical protein bcCo53_001131 [Borrelia coriaceae]
MKYISIIFILTLLILIACDPKKDSQIQEHNADLQAMQAQLKPNDSKYIIMELKIIAERYTKVLNDHINYAWIEDGAVGEVGENYGRGNNQYGMRGDNKAFDVIKNPEDNSYKYNDYYGKASRSKIYLVFEHEDNLIRKFAEVVNTLAASASTDTNNPNEYNNLLQKLADDLRAYAQDYFIVAFNTLIEKQNKLDTLTTNELQTLRKKFYNLKAEREMHIQDAKTIYNDFNSNKGDIKTNPAKLKDYYINNYKQKFKNSLEKVKTLAGEIKTILDKI